MHCPASTLKSLDEVDHSALCFLTLHAVWMHRCFLSEEVGWRRLAEKTEQHCFLFISKALLGKLPIYYLLPIWHLLTIDQVHTALHPKTIWSLKINTLVLRLGNWLLNIMLQKCGTIYRNVQNQTGCSLLCHLRHIWVGFEQYEWVFSLAVVVICPHA